MNDEHSNKGGEQSSENDINLNNEEEQSNGNNTNSNEDEKINENISNPITNEDTHTANEDEASSGIEESSNHVEGIKDIDNALPNEENEKKDEIENTENDKEK